MRVTPRQAQVLDLKCRSGMTDLQVAQRLGIAEQTVKNTLARIRRNNAARNTTHACALFMRRVME